MFLFLSAGCMPHDASCVVGSHEHFRSTLDLFFPQIGILLLLSDGLLCVKYGFLKGWFIGVITTAFVTCISERGHDWMGAGWVV